MSYTYINEDEIDLELKCTICYEPFQSPANCIKCGQTYCQECINTWRQEQSSCPICRENGSIFAPLIVRIVINQLNRLLVQCSLCQQTNIQRGNFPDHLSQTCQKQIINCINHKCRWKGCREDLEKHLIKCQRKRSKLFHFPRIFNCFGCVSLS